MLRQSVFIDYVSNLTAYSQSIFSIPNAPGHQRAWTKQDKNVTFSVFTHSALYRNTDISMLILY